MAATKDRVTIELYVDDQGTIRIRDAKVAVEELGAANQGIAASAGAATNSMAGWAPAVQGALAPLAALLGITISVGGAIAIVSSGIKEISEFNLESIATAAMMLSRAGIEGIAEQQTAYGQYKAYVLTMYEDLEAETVRHFASGKEMIQTFDAFAKQGIYASKEEAGAVGVVTDAVKLLHGGYIDNLTAMHEIRGVLEGHAGMHYRLAQILAGQIGPQWKEIVQSHIQDGTLLQFMADQFKGLSVASADIQQNLKAQETTLYTLFSQVGRGGLADAYIDIVGLVKGINDWLRVHKDELITGIARGWQVVQDLVKGTLGAIQIISNLVSNSPIVWGITIATSITGPAAKWLASGAGPGADFGLGGGAGEYYADQRENDPAYKNRNNQMLADQAAKYKTETYQKYLQDNAAPPPWKPSQLGDAKGGKSTEGAENSMLSLVDRLRGEIAKMSEGSIAAIDAYKFKMVDDINKLVNKGIDGSEAMALAEQSASLKKEKATDDFYHAMAKEAGDAYMAIDLWAEKSLKDWQGVRDKITGQPIDVTAWVQQATDKKYYEQSLKDWNQMIGLQEKYFSGMAAASPFLSDQLALEGQVLELQNQQAQAKLDDLIYHEKLNDQWRVTHGLAALMTPAMEAQLRLYEKQTEELKLQAQQRKQWATEGISGYAKSWAFDRTTGMDKRGLDEFKSMMGSAESWLGDTFGKSAYDTLLRKKMDFQKFFQDSLGNALTWVFKQSAKTIFDTGAGLLASKPGGAGGGLTGGDPTKQLSQAAQGLNKASLGFNLNTAQFGLAAGGLLLSGIGIATNSQALVMAGAVLQVAGLAIQLYQVLTATIVTAEMSVAAAALSSAAAGLSFAAVMLRASGFRPLHTGGVVAHAGLLVAHNGLNTDERLIKAQVGEWIINRDAVAELGRQGVSFDMVNAGRIPGAPLPVPLGNFTTPGRQAPAGGGEVHNHYNFQHNSNYNKMPDDADRRRDARAQLRALNRETRRRT